VPSPSARAATFKPPWDYPSASRHAPMSRLLTSKANRLRLARPGAVFLGRARGVAPANSATRLTRLPVCWPGICLIGCRAVGNPPVPGRRRTGLAPSTATERGACFGPPGVFFSPGEPDEGARTSGGRRASRLRPKSVAPASSATEPTKRPMQGPRCQEHPGLSSGR
jgi:hypothetical protein